MMFFYQLFDETITSTKPFLNEQNLDGILNSLHPALITPLVLYIIFFVFYFLFLTTAKLNLRKNGWLFIITVLILVTAPFEIYLMTIDYQIFIRVDSGLFQSGEVIRLIMKRMKDLSSFPVIELLCYCAVVFLAIFKPMTKKD